ncbi:corrinoid adenosyltransferase MMAB-like isoform X2 [Anthonomus grandis grandis]|uniref:corrinoid adenosyltransferase MMAB-like isoform X2 n=1 Tax=Anthonomus grandis grandis TaxID=2921223 RepID=UPI002165591F|nr:corrinoid adenosyltransferase MMAB-like isoform X2 [Anthonomus grandis grandis]
MAFRRILNPRPLNQIRQYCVKKQGENKATTDNPVKMDIAPIFSRDGDTGTSKTIMGESLPKDSPVFNAIGATEELLSYLGLAREHANESEHEYTDKLKRIQTIIIDISTAISRNNKMAITPVYTKELEDWISDYAKQLPPAEQYIIPGGGVASASLHVARAICRKTERVICPLVREKKLDKEALVYLNRLSDFLLTVSRIAAKHDQRVESIYIPKPDEKVQGVAC